MSNGFRVGALALMFAVMTWPAAAQGSSEDEDRRDRAAIGGGAVKQGNGLWRVRLANGEEVTAHGADMAADHGMTIQPGDSERAPVCATDASAVHVVYGRPSSMQKERSDAREQIASAVRRMNALLHEDAMLSGAKSADYEVLCDGTGAIRIDTFTNSATASFTDVVNAMKRANFQNPRGADHLIFYDGPAAEPYVCGIGTIYLDERLSADNYNNVRDGYSVVYQPCWDGRTPMHENGHNMGAVQIDAPNSTGKDGYHCAEVFDVMCYTPDGGEKNQDVIMPLCPAMRFDCGHDTYFDAAPEPGEWLSNHWNIGSPLNNYIRFGPLTLP